MRYRLLATDFDGTLARRGCVGEAAAEALRRWRRAGGLLAMVTGRELDEIIAIYPGLAQFDIVVAENGAMLYWPSTGRELMLAEPPPPRLVAELRRRGVQPMSAGRVVVGAWLPDEDVIAGTLRDVHLDLEVIHNKGSLMVLPHGIDKASGLRAALGELDVGAPETVGFGDGENDLPFLEICGLSVAVANAIEVLRERADIVTRATHGEGLAEAVNALLAHSGEEPFTASGAG